ncbi:hypothetical protein [Vogesella indigofera]|uniref:NlpE-like protein n=1 Tax=Vogesella indigofera TaxID=45465 RepID=A0ABT5I6F6_VOGIN|nr:hypothetical protein [Vogesella indigofera]MDC7691759.1 hypothetical protein [Vogesella indigofera]MDC7698806.1 hypothetical protein [Vogesella indigofera]
MKTWLVMTSLLLGLSAHAETQAVDLFTGTLEKNGSEWVLKRCDTAKSRYLLRDSNGEARAVEALLALQNTKPNEVITVSLLASYHAQNGQHRLHIASVQGRKQGSCHLDALFD